MTTRAEKISGAMLAVSFCGLAFFVPFSISGSNTSILIGFLGIALSAIAVPSTRKRISRVRTDPMLLACVLLVVSALPSVVMSENSGRALRDWKSYWLLSIYFFAAYGLWSWRLRRAVYWILFGSAALSCLVAISQYRGGIDLLFVHVPAKPRPAGTLFIMTFAGILYQLITVNFCVLFHRGRFSRLEWVLAGGIVLQVIGLFLTLTRGAWLALGAGLSAASAILRKREPLVVMAVLLAVVVAFAAGDSRVRRKIASIPRSLQGPTDVNVSTRYVLWDVSWRLIEQHPVLGVGMGDFTTEAEKLIGDRHVETTTDSHNVYLQILATRGLVGFLPFLFFWVVLLRTLWRARSSPALGGAGPESFHRHFSSGVFAAAVALLVGALTENNIDDSEVFTAFMLLAGLAKNFVNYPDPKESASASGSFSGT